MIRPSLTRVSTLVGVIVLCVAAVAAEESTDKPAAAGPPMPPEQQVAMAQYMATLQPGEHHRHLDYFVGSWDTRTRIFMGGPGSEAVESSGTAEVRWVLGKRYILDEFKGSMMGEPYEGLGLTGYDNYKNLYVSAWANSMDTQFLTMKGQRNPETGVFTYYGEMDEPMLNVHGRSVKYVTRIIDEDHYVFEIFDLHAGDDYKVVEILYSRRKQ